MSATYTGPVNMEFLMGDDISWTVTVSVPGVTTLAGWTISLDFTSVTDGTKFTKTEADADWIDNAAASSLQFDVIVDSTPATINTSGDTYMVKASIVNGTVRHHLGAALWRFFLPPGGAYGNI